MGESDNAWVFDSLVCFLNGPVWNAPLQSFIEEKSLIFEANVSDSPEYRQIFEEYKNLVDLMLGSYMEDIGITPLQFEEACNKGQAEVLPKHFDHNLFEQIWAANDYEMFKRMMTQRNVELQLQALELIEQKYGIMPQSFIPHKNKAEASAGVSASAPDKELEKEVMEEVIKKFPYEEENKPQRRKSVVEYFEEEKQMLMETLKNIESGHGDFLPNTPKEKVPNTSIEKEMEARKEKKKEKESKQGVDVPSQAEIKYDKKPRSTEIDTIELKKRQEYLRAQRDKLVALKKEARKKHLDDDKTANDKSKVRPKSAKVAEAVMTGNTTIEPQQLQIRKALAERLRAEVINADEAH